MFGIGVICRICLCTTSSFIMIIYFITSSLHTMSVSWLSVTLSSWLFIVVSWLSIFSLSLLPTIGDHGSHNFVFIIIFSCVVVIYNWVVICDEVGVLGCLVLSFGIRNLLTLQHRFRLWGSLLRLHCVRVESTTVFKGQHRTITLPMKKELMPSTASYGSHQKMRWDRFGAVYTKGRKDPPCSKGDGLLGSSRQVVKTVLGNKTCLFTCIR